MVLLSEQLQFLQVLFSEGQGAGSWGRFHAAGLAALGAAAVG